MITAASETDVVRHALRGGVTDYIVKPLMFDRFKASLEGYQKDYTVKEEQSIIYGTN